jgi:hypothetical protein
MRSPGRLDALHIVFCSAAGTGLNRSTRLALRMVAALAAITGDADGTLKLR